MKSYLSLIPISAKVHKRQNRMTLLCIIIAVFLVTTVFGIADMSVQMEKTRLIERHGNWHIAIQDVSPSDAEQIGARSDVETTSWYDVINDNMEEGYYISGKKAVLCGADEKYITKIWKGLADGTYPKNDSEIMLSSNAKTVLGINIGDRVTVNTPAGEANYIVSGFGQDDTSFNNQNYVIRGFMNMPAFHKLCLRNGSESINPFYYVQFKEHTSVNKAVADIEQQYKLTDEKITNNTGLLAITGFSSDSAMGNLYAIAAVLFVLILIAGVLMISGSINSNVAQRTKFFGMLRCIGASRQQIIRFVRLEALNWCKTAIPCGVAIGVIVTWGICAVLRFGIGGEFAEMPLFKFSEVGVISGVIVGIVTVLIAAQSPAKRAAKASPVAAVSGSSESAKKERHAANTHVVKIETALGIHHAVSAKKNLILMTGSFALSIILFLGFCTGLDFAHALLPSLRPWQPDCSIIGYENSSTVDKGLVNKISKMAGVKRVFGNMYAGGVPASSNKSIDHINLVSYDTYMLSHAKDSIVSGEVAKVYENSDCVLTIYNINNPLKVGDKIQLGGAELNVEGALSDGLFADDITVICSEETFMRLLGEHDYAMISIQLTSAATSADISAISALSGDANIFSDLRESNRETNSTFWAFRIFAYSFLAIIAMITVFNIINSTSMSVSARIKQYGAMRAVGMNSRQLTKMIAAEVFTYALCGGVVCCVLGLMLNWILYEKLITTHFGVTWSLPITELVIILFIVIAAAAAAIYTPSKRIKNMAITDTINEL